MTTNNILEDLQKSDFCLTSENNKEIEAEDCSLIKNKNKIDLGYQSSNINETNVKADCYLSVNANHSFLDYDNNNYNCNQEKFNTPNYTNEIPTISKPMDEIKIDAKCNNANDKFNLQSSCNNNKDVENMENRNKISKRLGHKCCVQ